MQGKAANIRPKVVRALPGPGASKSYMHRAALLYRFKSSQWLIFMTSVYFLCDSVLQCDGVSCSFRLCPFAMLLIWWKQLLHIRFQTVS
jgi:hypothetical protein